MAQRVHVELVDDLDGKSQADETIIFGMDGIDYRIDLSEKNAVKFREAMGKFIAAGTRVGKSANARAVKKTQIGPSAREVRDWAKSAGMDVPERGRIPDEIRNAFEAAH